MTLAGCGGSGDIRYVIKVYTPTDAQVFEKRSIKIYIKTAPTGM